MSRPTEGAESTLLIFFCSAGPVSRAGAHALSGSADHLLDAVSTRVRGGTERCIRNGLMRPDHAITSEVTIASEHNHVTRNCGQRHVTKLTMEMPQDADAHKK